MATTIEQVRKDFESYRKVCRRQRGVMLHADKYVEDIGLLLELLGGKSKKRREAKVSAESKSDE